MIFVIRPNKNDAQLGKKIGLYSKEFDPSVSTSVETILTSFHTLHGSLGFRKRRIEIECVRSTNSNQKPDSVFRYMQKQSQRKT